MDETTALTNGTTSSCSSFTIPQWHYTYGTPNPYFPFQIRKVENGFILCTNGKEFVFNKLEEMTKLLAKELVK